MFSAIIGASALAVSAYTAYQNWKEQQRQRSYERGLQKQIFDRR